MTQIRSKLLSLLGAAVVAGATARDVAAQAQVQMTTTRVASGLTLPLYVTSPPGDTNRLFIVEQRSGSTGRIKVLDLNTGIVSGTIYLSVPNVATGNEQGLLGLAFDPNFASNGFFFIDYTNASGTTVIARYQANAPYLTSTTANAASATTVLTIAQPFTNHNGGWVAFGPDGYLYIAMGDGGSANDPNGNGQNINVLLGKLLRIDVSSLPYTSPPTNPFFGVAGADEIWQYGLRNPWRDSFDRATGDLWIGDVGQNAWEEISFQPAGQGGLDFGWRCMEGFHCTGLTGCTCNGPGLTLPKYEYGHTGGACSVTGGYVYRGNALCGVQGTYFFADYCNAQIWSFRLSGGAVTQFTTRTAELAPGGGLAINSITSFGEDASGELYICDQGGEIFKIVPRAPTTDCNVNGQWDVCDIQNGTSLDVDSNGVPDECQFSVTPYCFGDGSGTACPCGNPGAAGNGCANSLNPAGANLTSSGTPSVSADSFLLMGSGMPDSSALYFQGTTQVSGGAGSAFGDGLRCAGGSVIRLGTKTNIGGQSTYPEILDQPISIRGGITGGPTTRTYQVWYRNAASFACPETFNLSSALSVVWVN